MADKTKQTTTDAPSTGEHDALPTFTQIAQNPVGITSRSAVAKLFDIHVLTLTRWVKAGKFPKPITIGNAHYFRNSELVDFLDHQQATA